MSSRGGRVPALGVWQGVSKAPFPDFMPPPPTSCIVTSSCPGRHRRHGADWAATVAWVDGKALEQGIVMPCWL
jgi:hypothetical protein